jgi:hypothetical protein
MRSVVLLTLVFGCGACAMDATVMSQPPDVAPGCLTIPVDDVSRQNCAMIDLSDAGGLSRTSRGSGFDTGHFLDLAAIPPAPDRSLQDADVTSAKPWIRGPEPRTALLAVSGFACIALLSWRRRISRARRRSRRHVYTIRQMA